MDNEIMINCRNEFLINKTYESLWSAHAFPEEQKRLVVLNEALELGTVRGGLNVAAMLAFPMRKISRSTECVVKARKRAVSLTSEKCLKISAEIVHLKRKLLNNCFSEKSSNLPDLSIRLYRSESNGARACCRASSTATHIPSWTP